MNLLVALLLVASAVTPFSLEGSCVERCQNGFDAKMRCQCDSMCRYYRSCCSDYDSICRTKTRGDTFAFPEDDDKDDEDHSSTPRSWTSSRELTLPRPTVAFRTVASTSKHEEFPSGAPPITTAAKAPDPDAEACSGKSFDAFLQLKNGNIYAFRGEYFYELDGRLVLLGYPRPIQDMWGISGPIDAAFTRINCQGKTYIFKGNQYWRFDGTALDKDYPRNISVGFEKIPDNVDAAFAIPASSHHGNEKVYFFKGDQYYQYEFRHQPSHEECISMTVSSPSIIFSRYADMYSENIEDYFSSLYRGIHGHNGVPRFIQRDWIGISAPVDAVLVGRIYVNPAQRHNGRRQRNNKDKQDWDQQRWEQQNHRQWSQDQHNSQNRDRLTEWGTNLGQDYQDRYYRDQDQNQQRNRYRQQQQQHNYNRYDRYNPVKVRDFVARTHPLQSVYFFKGDQYYRVNLQTKTVDYANPPYPRSIGKYWLGCPEKQGAERK